MKRILSLVLAVILLMSSAVLVACDDTSDEPAATTTATTAPQDQDDENPEEEKKSNTVETVNGMNAKQLYEKFCEEYLAAKTFDLYMTDVVYVDESTTSTTTVELKFTEDEVYFSSHSDSDEDESFKMWLVDGVMYVDSTDVKICGESGSVEELLGMSLNDALNEMVSDVFSEAEMEIYLEKLNKAKIYIKGDGYCFSVTLTDEEATQILGEESKGFKETVYVDAQGKVTKSVAESEDGITTMILNTYGGAVSITAPENAGEFMDIAGAFDENPGAFALYESLLEKIGEINTLDYYDFWMTIDGQYVFDYRRTAEGENLIVYDDDEYIKYWYIDGKLYMADINTGYGNPVEITLTDEILGYFEQVRTLPAIIATYKVSGLEMSDLQYDDTRTLSFNVGEDTWQIHFYEYENVISLIDVSYGEKDAGQFRYVFANMGKTNLSLGFPGIQ